MKRLLLLLICLLPVFACAEELRVSQTSGPNDRVKLRESPGGRVIGQYYNHVRATPLETEGDWTRISIGGREGWMMSEFLPAVTDEWLEAYGWLSQGKTGAVLDPAEPLYAEPDTASEILLHMDEPCRLLVLGTVDDDWLHVLYTDSPGSVVYGFASAWSISWTDNLGHADVDTDKAEQRLNLRAAPSTSADVIAELYSGTEVIFLFDDHVNYDGWAKVRVGGLRGYVSEEYLNYSSAGVLAFEPPLCLLEDGRSAQVLAIRDGDVYVQHLVNPDDQGCYWISRNSASRYNPRSASTAARTNCAVTAGDYALPEGYPVHIYGSYDPTADVHAWGYIHPEHPLIKVDFEIPGSGTWTGSYLPLDCVDFDVLLLAPSAQ